MTISSDAPRKAGPYPGNGVATSFPFNFKVFADTDVVVTLVTLATFAESVLNLVADYTVVLNADQNASPGGSVNYKPLGVPMDALHEIYITSAVRELQPLDLTNGGGFFPKVISDALDRAVILIQQLDEQVSRSLKVSLGSGLSPADISSLAALNFNFVLADGSVGTAKLALGAVTSAKIADGTILIADLNREVLNLITTGGGGSAPGGNTSAAAGGGRLSFATGVPVMLTDVADAASVYYAPFSSSYVLLNDGTGVFTPTAFTELTQPLADATKSPAASLANSVYDIFAWGDAGATRISRGPAWASDTTRGVGAGTTEIELAGSSYVNKFAIINGPVARRGTYLGTIMTNAANTLDWKLGAPAVGGSPAWLGVWNVANKVRVGAVVQETTVTWTYGSTTVRPSNNSVGMRATFVRGLNEDSISVYFQGQVTPGSGTNAAIGIGLDSTTALASGQSACSSGTTGVLGTVAGSVLSNYRAAPGLGKHFIQGLEFVSIAVASNFQSGPTYGHGLFFDFIM